MSLLHLDHVSYTYEKAAAPVLCGITADFESGKMYALTGKSGAGKTTLLSLLSGIDVCTEGSVCYAGNDLKKSTGTTTALPISAWYSKATIFC